MQRVLLLILALLSYDNKPGKVVNHWIFFIDASGSVVNPISKARSYKKFLRDSLINFLQNSSDIPHFYPTKDYSSIVYFGIVPNNLKKPIIREDLTVDSIPCSISLLKNYYFDFENDYLHERLSPGFHRVDSLQRALYPPSPHYCFTFLSIAEPSVFVYLSHYSKELIGKIRRTFLVLISDDNYNNYECYHELRFLRSIGGGDYLEKLSKFEKKYYLDLIYTKSFNIGNSDWGLYLYEIKNLKIERFFSQYKDKRGLNWIESQKLYSSWVKPVVHYKLHLSDGFVKNVFSTFNVKDGWVSVSIIDSVTSINKGYLNVIFPISPINTLYKIDKLPITPMRFTFTASPKVLFKVESNFVVYDSLLGSQWINLRKSFELKRPRNLEYFGKVLISALLIFLSLSLIMDLLSLFILCFKLPLRFDVLPTIWDLSFGDIVEPMSDDYTVSCTFSLEWVENRKILTKLPLIGLVFKKLYKFIFFVICKAIFAMFGSRKLIFEVELNDQPKEVDVSLEDLYKGGKLFHKFHGSPSLVRLVKPFKKKPLIIRKKNEGYR